MSNIWKQSKNFRPTRWKLLDTFPQNVFCLTTQNGTSLPQCALCNPKNHLWMVQMGAAKMPKKTCLAWQNYLHAFLQFCKWKWQILTICRQNAKKYDSSIVSQNKNNMLTTQCCTHNTKQKHDQTFAYKNQTMTTITLLNPKNNDASKKISTWQPPNKWIQILQDTVRYSNRCQNEQKNNTITGNKLITVVIPCPQTHAKFWIRWLCDARAALCDADNFKVEWMTQLVVHQTVVHHNQPPRRVAGRQYPMLRYQSATLGGEWPAKRESWTTPTNRKRSWTTHDTNHPKSLQNLAIANIICSKPMRTIASSIAKVPRLQTQAGDELKLCCALSKMHVVRGGHGLSAILIKQEPFCQTGIANTCVVVCRHACSRASTETRMQQKHAKATSEQLVICKRGQEHETNTLQKTTHVRKVPGTLLSKVNQNHNHLRGCLQACLLTTGQQTPNQECKRNPPKQHRSN